MCWNDIVPIGFIPLLTNSNISKRFQFEYEFPFIFPWRSLIFAIIPLVFYEH